MIPKSQMRNRLRKSPRKMGTHSPKKNSVHENPSFILFVTPDECLSVIFTISPLIDPHRLRYLLLHDWHNYKSKVLFWLYMDSQNCRIYRLYVVDMAWNVLSMRALILLMALEVHGTGSRSLWQLPDNRRNNGFKAGECGLSAGLSFWFAL